MALKGLSHFLKFNIIEFLIGKRIFYVKADVYKEDEVAVGSKVILQILSDGTNYDMPISNFGEQLVVKVLGVSPEFYESWKPLGTEVEIRNVSKAVVFGDYRNQLSITGEVVPKEAK